MNIIKNFSTDIPTQLWISSRYMGAISLLLSYGIWKKKSSKIQVKLIVLGYTIYLFHRDSKNINKEIYTILMWSLISTIISEIYFTLYTDSYGSANVIGHIFKIISFYFIYKIERISIEFSDIYD